MLSGHVVLVAPLSEIGSAAALKPAIENKKRKIDSLSDGLGAELDVQYAGGGWGSASERPFLQL